MNSDDLAKVLVQLSGNSWALVADAQATVGFAPREETLTESFLIELRRLAPNANRVWKTTVAEENVNKADFAWAIQTTPGVWVHLLIQAKKLFSSGAYEDLRKPSSSENARKLREAADESGALGVYLMYNGYELANVGDPLSLGGCAAPHLLRELGGPPWLGNPHVSPGGCTVIPALAIQDRTAKGSGTRPSEYSDVAAPLECLLCPIDDGSSAIPWRQARIDGPSPDPDFPWASTVPPEWAASLLETGDLSEVRRLPAADYLLATRIASDSRAT